MFSQVYFFIPYGRLLFMHNRDIIGIGKNVLNTDYVKRLSKSSFPQHYYVQSLKEITDNKIKITGQLVPYIIIKL